MPGTRTPIRPAFAVVPIQQVDVYGEARSKLRELIDSGSYAPDDKLPSERALAEALNVSRVVVREAMKVLEYMGKVEIRHGAGTFVRQPQADPLAAALLHEHDVDDAFLHSLVEARTALEARAVELATARGAAADWDELRAVLARNAEEHLPDAELGSLNLLFEQAVARVADSPVLTALQRSVHELWVVAWGERGLAPADKHRLHDEHGAILDAMAAGDRRRAVRLMTRHVDRSLLDAVAAAEESDDA